MAAADGLRRGAFREQHDEQDDYHPQSRGCRDPVATALTATQLEILRWKPRGWRSGLHIGRHGLLLCWSVCERPNDAVAAELHDLDDQHEQDDAADHEVAVELLVAVIDGEVAETAGAD